LALTARILLLLAGLVPATLLLAGLLTRVLILLARVLVLAAHSGISLVDWKRGITRVGDKRCQGTAVPS